MRHGSWQNWGEHWGPFVPFGRRRGARFFDPGEVRLAILSLLEEGPKHGYQLMKELSERSGGWYAASAGVIYPTLQLLEDEGLVQSERQDGKRVYRITDVGREELQRDPEAVRRIWARAERWEDWSHFMSPEAITFMGPFASVAKAGFRAAGWAAGRAEREDRLRAILDRFRRELEDLIKA